MTCIVYTKDKKVFSGERWNEWGWGKIIILRDKDDRIIHSIPTENVSYIDEKSEEKTEKELRSVIKSV